MGPGFRSTLVAAGCIRPTAIPGPRLPKCKGVRSTGRHPPGPRPRWPRVPKVKGRTTDGPPPAWTRPALPIRFPLTEQREFRSAMDRFYDRLETLLAKGDDVTAREAPEPGSRWNNMLTAVRTFS